MTDQSAPDLLARQYGTDERLRIRVETHLLYSRRRGSFHAWVLGHLRVAAGMSVADVGCGYGHYHPLLAHAGVVHAVDPSPAMRDAAQRQARELHLPVQVLAGGATHLPLADASCDRAMCNHVLYHVADRVAALAEMRRVLRPGGRVVIATNRRGSDPGGRFNLDDHHELVCRVFPDALRKVRDDDFLFPTVDAVERYYGTFDTMPAGIVEEARRSIASDGVYRVPKPAGCFVATVRG